MKRITTTILAITTCLAARADSLPQYLQTAAENNPGVKAGFSTYRAALQKIPQAGALQDPQLEMGFFLQPMEIVDGKQIADIRLMQMFPWFGTRKAARTEAQHMAQMAFEQFRETRDKLFLDVYTQWFTLCRLQQQLKNNRENRKLLLHLEELALRKFSAPAPPTPPKGGLRGNERSENKSLSTSPPSGMAGGGGMNMSAASPPSGGAMTMGSMPSENASSMSDILQIRLEIAEIDNNMENIQSEMQAEKAKFNALLNRPPESALAIPDTLRQIPFLLDMPAFKTRMETRNPMLNMIVEEEATYRAKVEMDRKMSYPMFGIGLQYMLIGKTAAAPASDNGMNAMSDAGDTGGISAMNGRDMIMPMLSVGIPIYRGKYRAQQRETAFLQQASREKYIDVRNTLEAELYRTKHQLDAAARQIALYRKQTELAQTTFDLMIREFTSGANDLSSVIQVQRQLLDYELKTAEAIADYNTMVAGIQKLVAMISD
jgi:outer membrane protein TolC